MNYRLQDRASPGAALSLLSKLEKAPYQNRTKFLRYSHREEQLHQGHTHVGLSSARGTLRMSERQCLQKTVAKDGFNNIVLSLTCNDNFKLKKLQ